MHEPDSHQSRKRNLIIGMGALLLLAVLIAAQPLVKASLAPAGENRAYLPVAYWEPTPTPTPAPTPTPYFYYDGFDDPASGWPEVRQKDARDRWYDFFYDAGVYRTDTWDAYTTHTASPWVALPEGDYVIEFDSRFLVTPGWYHASGIYFDGNDAADEFKDYFAFRILWWGTYYHLWGVVEYRDGKDVDPVWMEMPESYDYGSDGTAWNHWKVVRKAGEIQLFCNEDDEPFYTAAYPRPAGREYFGVYGSTFEVDILKVAWDNYTVYPFE